MAVIGINYDGGKRHDNYGNEFETPLIYEGVYIHFGRKNDEEIFNSGNFIKDWFNAKKKFAEIMDKEPYLSASSSVNHFFFDGADYDSAYLHFIDGKPVLKYIDHSDPHYLFTQSDIFEKGWEFFVEKGTKPTWEELKEYCKN